MNQPPQSPTFIGRYEVIEELGRGAMGVVLLARDPVLERQVAIKFLRPDLQLEANEKELLMRRMKQEAQAIARVRHKGIVALHDIGDDPKLATYLVFERVEGPTLEAALERGRLTKEGAARLAREMGEALEAAHAQNVLHRDIKPANVILTEEGAKIADFGVARLPNSTLTRAGARVGTPAYSAPEAIRKGEHEKASDQFSMAACLYEAISGRRAFPGSDAVEVARQVENEQPLPLAPGLGLSPRVDSALLRGMARASADRFSSCRELGVALSEALVGVREMTPTLPDAQTLVRHDRRERSRQVGYAVLFALLGATVALSVVRFLGFGAGAAAGEEAPPLVQEGPPLRPAVLTVSPEGQ